MFVRSLSHHASTLFLFITFTPIILAADSFQPMRSEYGELFLGYGKLESFDVSTVDETVATCGGSGVVIWSYRENEPTVIHQLQAESVSRLDFSFDGAYLLTGDSNGFVQLWDVDSGRKLNQFQASPHAIFDVAFSTDNAIAYIGDYKSVAVWDVFDGEKIRDCDGADGNGIAASPDGQWFVTASPTPTLWNAETGNAAQTIYHDQPNGSAVFSPDGRWFLFGGGKREIVRWNVETGEADWTVQHDPSSSSLYHYAPLLAVSPDGAFVASGGVSNATVTLRDANDGSEIKAIDLGAGYIFNLEFSKDGDRLFVQKSGGGITCIDVETGQEAFSLDGYASPFRSGVFTSDGTTVLTGNGHDINEALEGKGGNNAVLWDSETGQALRSFGEEEAWNEFAVFVDRWTVLTGTINGVGRSWIAQTSERLNEFRRDNSYDYCQYELSPDGGRLLIAAIDEAVLLDLKTGEIVQTCLVPGFIPRDVKFFSDGSMAVLAYNENKEDNPAGNVLFWNLHTGEIDGVINACSGMLASIDLTSDNKRLLVDSWDLGVAVWDVETKEIVTLFDWLATEERKGSDIAFYTPDDKYIAFGDGKGMLQFLDAITGDEIWKGRADAWLISDVAFSPDGTKMLTTGISSARIWNLPDLIPTTGVRDYKNY